MAYFSKDVYEKKRNYAVNTAISSLDILCEATGRSSYELDIVSELSHARHNIHSDIKSWNNSQLMSYIGCTWSDDITLIERVNSLHLVDFGIPKIELYWSDLDDSIDDIIDELDIIVPDNIGDDIDRSNYVINELMTEQYNIIDNWSGAVRAWFHELNSKYGTNYPS